MNQKNYKAIAKIIRFNGGTWDFVNDLADYFWQEDEEVCNSLKGKKIIDKFDRKQFLKDCGVKE